MLAYRDFRLLWLGAFISFTGGHVQIVAQGYFVYLLTRDEGKLALVNFAGSLPVFLFGFVAGSLTDALPKRSLLIGCQVLLSAGCLYLAYATYQGFVTYPQILLVALLLGLVFSVEMPTRQSIVSRIVSPEDLAAAVPVNAMTFNIARITGPAIGALLLLHFGVAACYLTNGITYLALVLAVLAIRADLSATPRTDQPIKDLIFEGALYTLREPRLRLLLILEIITAGFGIFYIPLIPAIIEQSLGFANGDAPGAKQAIGHAYTSIGVGAFLGLLLVTSLSDSPNKRRIILLSMAAIAVGLALLSVVREPWLLYAVLAVVGSATIMQFNTTNALFQILSPDRLRGRVLSMHVWALNGFSPFGILAMGSLASFTRPMALPNGWSGLPLTLRIGALLMAIGLLYGWRRRAELADLSPLPAPG